MIRLNNVVASYRTGRGSINAVDGVTLDIPDGCIMGVAGESGCGKSTLMKLIYGDIQSPMALASGSIEYGFADRDGHPITSDTIRDYWFKRISYIPQSSMNSLNPVVRVGRQFTDFPGSEPDKKRVMEQVRSYITKLGLPAETLDSYPHQLSGGMRQRVMIAMATFFQPGLILADEPTTALDVVVQKDILVLLMELQEQMGNTILLVSHDMGVHYQVTTRMLIMYAAKAVEYGDSESVFRAPLHPYTRMLTDSLPTIGDDRAREGIPGRPPSLWEDLHGCRFADRCPLATARCRTEEPALLEHRPGHFAACHYAGQFSGPQGTPSWQ
jgi:peptide/nickel transport system ATP-binding protein